MAIIGECAVDILARLGAISAQEVAGVVLAALGVAGISVALWRRLRSRARDETLRAFAADGLSCVDLSFQHEVKNAHLLAPICVVNVYKVNSGDGEREERGMGAFDETQEKALRQRLEVVAKANPWILGRLGPSLDPMRCVAIWTPTSAPPPASAHALLSVEDEPRLTPGTPLDGVYRLARRCAIGGGRLLSQEGRTHGPVFRVVALRGASGACALIVSMSHVAGDASTFYRIYRMLAGTEDVQPLQVKRLAKHLPYSDELWRWLEGGPLWSFLVSGIVRACKVAGTHDRAVQYLDVDDAELDRRKKTPTDRVPFLSSHDVACAAAFRATRAHLAYFATDMRTIAPDHVPPTQAGNYVCPAVLTPERDGALDEPATIRARVQHLRAHAWETQPAPQRRVGLLRALWSVRLATVTSWCFGPTTWALPLCEQLIHSPVLPPVGLPMRIVCLFEPRGPKSMAMVITAPECDGREELLAGPLVRGPLAIAW